ncbi:hypothetical protein E4U38_005209 [Claviceps purpurea]|nr:hypothetical protein E4U12_008421 [Claviceps purpurea]KAG6142626.1 hypothetical protein E4U38_005209 [Claviceps purpurea]KAG6151025.1 hypothetical protein E4U11_008022 [Claviceps purpurea]KAG6211193.1 hypothetical protein E4U50_002389 [Claviceps purpurea]KAG6252599.1 hypothetical protein E4U23_008640 [Claviceps purpurea]
MSTSPMLREFLVIIPDKPSVRKTRLALRSLHVQNMTHLVASGQWKMGGALLNSVPDLEDDPTKFDFMGSTFVCRAESRAEVFEQVKQDVYASGGVWDLARFDANASYGAGIRKGSPRRWIKPMVWWPKIKMQT